LEEPKQQALTFGFSFPTLLGLLPTVVLIIALATVGFYARTIIYCLM
jgi:hypothetical protein